MAQPVQAGMAYHFARNPAYDNAGDHHEPSNVLNAGFDQIFNLYNPLVMETADIIDTWVYRVGLVERQYSLGTAVGLLRSIVGII